MSESVEPCTSSPEPTTEPITDGTKAERDEFFEARVSLDSRPTDGDFSDVEDDDSEASFHSLLDDLQQCGLEESGTETAFIPPSDRPTSGDSTVTERLSPYDHSGGWEGSGSNNHVEVAAVDASLLPSEGHLDTRSSPDQDTLKDELHPRLLADQETVREDSPQENHESVQGEGAAEIPTDTRTNILYSEMNCNDAGGGNDDVVRRDGGDKQSSDPSNGMINEPDCNSGSLDEGLLVEDNPLSPEEVDICCLTSVKAMDEEWELKVKDRDTDLSQEELDAHTVSAVAEKREGNVLFASGLLTDAITRYNAGLRLCPLTAAQDRAMLYHNRAVAYDKMEERKLAVHSLSRALELDPSYSKALARRAGLHEAMDSLDEALADYKALLELDPGHRLARAAVQRLPPMIEERNEKLKAEMLGKLKDLGNMFLRPFGLSTQNFQMQQDPSTGGYNINFQQNPAN